MLQGRAHQSLDGVAEASVAGPVDRLQHPAAGARREPEHIEAYLRMTGGSGLVRRRSPNRSGSGNPRPYRFGTGTLRSSSEWRKPSVRLVSQSSKRRRPRSRCGLSRGIRSSPSFCSNCAASEATTRIRNGHEQWWAGRVGDVRQCADPADAAASRFIAAAPGSNIITPAPALPPMPVRAARRNSQRQPVS